MPKVAGRRPGSDAVAQLIQETAEDVRAARIAIRTARKKVFKNARQAAKATGLGHSTVARLENVDGENDQQYDPSIGTVLRLLKRFGIPVAEFFAGLEQPPTPSLKQKGQVQQDASPTEAHDALVSAILPKILTELSYRLTEAADRTLADRQAASPRAGKSRSG